MQEKTKKSYLKRFFKQLIVSGMIFAILMAPNALDNPTLKELQSKAKNIVFYEINMNDITETVKKLLNKISTPAGETQNEYTSQTYPDA